MDSELFFVIVVIDEIETNASNGCEKRNENNDSNDGQLS